MKHTTLRFAHPVICLYILLVLTGITGCPLFNPTDSAESDPTTPNSIPVVPEDPTCIDASLKLTKPSGKNLGTVVFLGNSHTFRTDPINTLARANNYQLNAQHMGAGGKVALGLDNATIKLISPFIEDGDKTGSQQDHLSAFMKRDGAKICNDDLTWIIVHDGTVFNSLTSSGAFMGLANAFGAKTACYENWDSKYFSDYDAKMLQLPLIPIGTMIPANNLQYHVNDGHMNNVGAYIFAVSFFHFLSKMPIDEIKGDAGIANLQENDMQAARELIKATMDKPKTYTTYFEIEGYDQTPALEKAFIIQCDTKKSVPKLALGKSVAFKLPAAAPNKKLTVTTNSSDKSIVPDIWIYNPAEKKIVAQGHNKENAQSYIYTGIGAEWEHKGECYLIVTRRGITSKLGTYDESTTSVMESEDPISDLAIVAIITESDVKPDFDVTVSFID